MNYAHPLQTLSFHWVVYPVREISKWLADPTVDCFVFALYFPASHDEARSIELCSFVFQAKNCINPNAPDLLRAYESNTLVVNGPLQLSANKVDAQKLRELLPPVGGEFEDLLFIPYLDLSQRVFYSIYGMNQSPTGVVLSSQPVNTNPSPPATA